MIFRLTHSLLFYINLPFFNFFPSYLLNPPSNAPTLLPPPFPLSTPPPPFILSPSFPFPFRLFPPFLLPLSYLSLSISPLSSSFCLPSALPFFLFPLSALFSPFLLLFLSPPHSKLWPIFRRLLSKISLLPPLPRRYPFPHLSIFLSPSPPHLPFPILNSSTLASLSPLPNTSPSFLSPVPQPLIPPPPPPPSPFPRS